MPIDLLLLQGRGWTVITIGIVVVIALVGLFMWWLKRPRDLPHSGE